MKKLLLACAFLLPIVLFAQTNMKVQFCEKYDAVTGETSGYYNSWDINPTGGFIYVVYSQNEPIKEPLVLEIERKEDGEYTFFASRNFLNDISARKTYAMFDMEFKKEGTYKVTVKTKNGKYLAETTTKISVVDPSDKTTTADGITSDYYEDSKVKFGTNIDDNAKITGEGTEFKLKNGVADIQIMILNGKVFKSEKVKLSVYKKIMKNGKEETNLVQTIPVTGIAEDWDWIKTNIVFKEKGDYIVDVWNENEVFINTGVLTIK